MFPVATLAVSKARAYFTVLPAKLLVSFKAG